MRHSRGWNKRARSTTRPSPGRFRVCFAYPFTIEGGLAAGFTLGAVPEQRAIGVLTRHVEPEPRRSHTLAPERIDEELLESLLSLLLRPTDRLISYEINPKVKVWLREEAERH